MCIHTHNYIKRLKMLPPGFEPGSSARKAGMIGRTTLRERPQIMGLVGFEPTTFRLKGGCTTWLCNRPINLLRGEDLNFRCPDFQTVHPIHYPRECWVYPGRVQPEPSMGLVGVPGYPTPQLCIALSVSFPSLLFSFSAIPRKCP